ncbi:MAG: CoA transferase, partial [Chloroflexi bacterium]|nr:CoA transferase [Chloroflexota bacterium]
AFQLQHRQAGHYAGHRDGRGGLLFGRLAEQADVVIEGYAPGHLARLGLDYETLPQSNSGLIMASITPFGQEGPYSGYVGTDLIGVAMGGLMNLCGFAEDPPNYPSGLQGYHMASIVACTGITMAVCARDFDPERRGKHLDISMQEAVSMSTLQTANANFHTVHKQKPGRAGFGSVGGRGRSVYQCKDGGWISFVVPPGFWDGFVEWLSEHDLAGDLTGPQTDNPSTHTVDPLPAIIEATRKLAALYDRDDLFHEGQKRRLLCMPVNTVEDLYRDEQLNSRGFFVSIEHSDLDDTLVYPGAPVQLSETPMRTTHAAPTLGQHSDEVFLGDLGLSEKELAELRSRGVI